MTEDRKERLGRERPDDRRAGRRQQPTGHHQRVGVADEQSP
jgi:hypothetical protein